MASFSRGIALLPLPLRALPRPAHPVGPLRFFTTSPLRLRAPPSASPSVKVEKKLPSKPSPPRGSPTTAAPSRYAFIKSLSSKQTPTVLYEAPSHFWFYFGCWSSGISILAWTALTGPTVVKQPDGTPQWVGYVFGASYVLLGAMGFYLLSKTPNIVSTIRVLPPAVSAAGAAHPRLEVTVKRMLPVLKPRAITASLENVCLKSRFSLPEEYVPQLKRLELKMREEEQRQALRKFDMEHLLTMPFRRLGRAFANMFRGVRSAWTDMGFGVLRVDGKEYKVDVTKGFAHDGFKTLEQIVAVGYTK
ncbi:hypothetical protein J3458_007107 [Metarhizium acridum]|uniref:Uncharacterized protein n=1 Tax=Metarhizium acridum (strain CQMa 102) TaxID=655827 RepID=E9EFL6_METAQ|nr:uncharacterized protein MAC_08664 [Metarhizium acridum CQMa 102]EFY85308.1 hypothetical protein MAC_08664 [Metarhizium acridum CQMa 102]KAG8416524.1 hypothetical protein J3458_007107 [Metarhizium acridum]